MAESEAETVDHFLDISSRAVGVTAALEEEPKDVWARVWAGCQLRAQGVGDGGQRLLPYFFMRATVTEERQNE